MAVDRDKCAHKGCTRKIRNKRRRLCRGHYHRLLYDPKNKTPLQANHGYRYTLSYRSWLGMRNRCNNPKTPDFRYYGKRGIKYCARWERFENFLIDMGERPSIHFTLDRINNDGNYTKQNCRWATRKQQSRNRKYCRLNLDKAKMIRHLFSKGNSVLNLTKRFHVSKSAISAVLRGDTW